MPNELKPGAHRTGNLVDFDPDTPPVQVTLERTEDRILLHVPWVHHESPYAGWFLDEDLVGGMELATRPIPRQLKFSDGNGSVLLVGCHHYDYQTVLFGPGTGTVAADYAILMNPDLHEDFTEVHGLASEISGLRGWLGLTSLREERNSRTDAEAKGYRWAVFSQETPALDVLPDGRLSLTPLWHYSPRELEDGMIVHDLLFCYSEAPTPQPWTTLLQQHLALRDLLVLSRWMDVSFEVRQVLRREDLIWTLDGKTHGHQWRQVVQARSELADPSSQYGPPWPLIKFADIGVEGLARWLSLRDEFARAFDPLVSSRLLRGTIPMTLVAHIGPGIEALGYLLLLRDGASAATAKDASLADRLRRILADLGDAIPFDPESFVTRTTASYNGIKHANRSLPSDLDLMNTAREITLLMRAWVAVELGIPLEDLKTRLANDAQATPWRLRN